MHRRSSPLDAKLDRRVPTNPKFAHIGSRLDTGKTINKVKYMSANAYLKRQDEVFFRISANQLGELMGEYDDEGNGGNSPQQQQQQQQLQRRAGGGSPNVRGGPTIVQYSEEEQPAYDKPFLLVDIRERCVLRKADKARERGIDRRPFACLLISLAVELHPVSTCLLSWHAPRVSVFFPSAVFIGLSANWQTKY